MSMPFMDREIRVNRRDVLSQKGNGESEGRYATLRDLRIFLVKYYYLSLLCNF